MSISLTNLTIPEHTTRGTKTTITGGTQTEKTNKKRKLEDDQPGPSGKKIATRGEGSAASQKGDVVASTDTMPLTLLSQATDEVLQHWKRGDSDDQPGIPHKKGEWIIKDLEKVTRVTMGQSFFKMTMDQEVMWHDKIENVCLFRVKYGVCWIQGDEGTLDGRGVTKLTDTDLLNLSSNIDVLFPQIEQSDTQGPGVGPGWWHITTNGVIAVAPPMMSILPSDRAQMVFVHVAVQLKNDLNYYMVHSMYDGAVVHHKVKFYPPQKEIDHRGLASQIHAVSHNSALEAKNPPDASKPPENTSTGEASDAGGAGGAPPSDASERLQLCFYTKRNLQKAEQAATDGEWSIHIEYALRNIVANVRLLKDDRLNQYLEEHLDDRICRMRHETDRVVTELIKHDVLNKLDEKLSEKSSDDSQAMHARGKAPPLRRQDRSN